MDPVIAPVLAEYVTLACVHRLRRLNREWKRCVDGDRTLPPAIPESNKRRCRECGCRSRHMYPLWNFACCTACRIDGYRATRRCRPSEPYGYQAKTLDTQVYRSLAILGHEVPTWLHDQVWDLFLSHVTLERVDLQVPFVDHPIAKHHGAHWDVRRRVWYAPAGFSLLFLARWCEEEDVSAAREQTRKLLRHNW